MYILGKSRIPIMGLNSCKSAIFDQHKMSYRPDIFGIIWVPQNEKILIIQDRYEINVNVMNVQICSLKRIKISLA